MNPKNNSRYVILWSRYLNDLMEMVNDFIGQGFVPCGGVTIDGDEGQYLQALYLPMQFPVIVKDKQSGIYPPYNITISSR